MSSCLGLFIDDNLIKYARVTKENDKAKIENYGIKFFDNDLESTVKQIIDETFSYQIPISVNISNEKYTNSEIFALLSEQDQRKSIKTEFEYYCNETGKNRLVLEYRTVVSDDIKDKDKKNALYVYTEKGHIAERMQLLDSYKISNISPIALTIADLNKNGTENSMFINLENRTEITTVVNGKPYRVDIIDAGMSDILKKISEKENSISKAYEICKNTTLYTASSQDLQTESNEYIETIIPTIFKIVDETKSIVEKNGIEIEKIYLSGTGTIINNIDLYFQENFMNTKCEILVPSFVDKTSLKLNIRDYIEVNSAISLAVQGIDKNNKKISFNKSSETWQKIKDVLSSDVGKTHKNVKQKKTKKNINLKINNLSCVRFSYSMLIILLIYVIATSILGNRIDKKTQIVEDVIQDTNNKEETINKYISLVTSKTEDYESIIEQLQEANDKFLNATSRKNAIPNLLSEIMFAVPKEVQILSISNTNEKHITIEAQSEEYQYLGYLKSELQNQAILVNIIATSGTRENDMIKITIEGDLPY